MLRLKLLRRHGQLLLIILDSLLGIAQDGVDVPQTTHCVGFATAVADRTSDGQLLLITLGSLLSIAQDGVVVMAVHRVRIVRLLSSAEGRRVLVVVTVG